MLSGFSFGPVEAEVLEQVRDQEAAVRHFDALRAMGVWK